MKIYLGADHRGYAMKEKMKRELKKKGYEIEDLGNTKKDPKDDYPDFAFSVAESVARKRDAKGMLFCGSGEGMAIVANKMQGVRAATAFSVSHARDLRKKNNANVLVLSTDHTSFETAKKIGEIFLRTPFSKEARHVRRLKKIERIERAT